MRLGRDGIAGLVLLAASVALFVQSFALQRLPLVPVGPGFYPRIVLAGLALASLLLVVADWRAQRRRAPVAVARPARAGGAAALAGFARRYGRVMASFAICGLYVALMPKLGFRISTALFVAGLNAMLEPPTTPARVLAMLALAAGTALVTFAMFEIYLKVLLPRGSWTGV